MGKIVDRICIAIALFVLCFVLIISISKNIYLALISSTLLALIITICISKLLDNRHQKYLNLKNFNTYMIVMGIDTILDTISIIYDEALRKEKYLILNDAILYPIFKFSPINKDDMIKCRQVAISEKKSKVYVISNSLDRGTINFSNILYDVTYVFVPSKELYRALKSKGKLPLMPPKVKRQHIPIKDIFISMLDRRNAKRYLFTSVILLFIGIFTPLRAYYYTLSALSAIMTLLSIFLGAKLVDSSHLPNKKDK